MIGSFCASACSEDEACPDGYDCAEGRCIATSGSCDCTEDAMAAGLTTNFVLANEIGTRTCAIEGLTECQGQSPTADVCDGVDNDCDGFTDTQICDDGNECTVDYCGGAAGCLNTPASFLACDDGDLCTGEDTCKDGQCAGDELTCDDSVPADVRVRTGHAGS